MPNPISLPDTHLEYMKQACPTAVRRVIAPPDGDLLNPEISPIDIVITMEPSDGPKIHTFWKPNEFEIDCLRRGGIIEFTWMGDHLHPISSQIWGGIRE